MEVCKVVPELMCSDITVTKDFYTRVFGFTLAYERLDEKFAYFTLDGADLMVEQLAAGGRQWITGEMQKPFGRGVHFEWQVRDVNAIHARIQQQALHAVYLQPETRGYACGDTIIWQRQCIAQDPDGYLFRFCQAQSR